LLGPSTPPSQGELRGLRKTDVDFDSKIIVVRRSYDRDRTKGAHEEGVPIAEELGPYLTKAIDWSPSELVFPKPDGSMVSKHVKLEGMLRRALARGHRHRLRARVQEERVRALESHDRRRSAQVPETR
jgi:integrase